MPDLLGIQILIGKIGQTVQKLQHFVLIQDGGGRHLDFWHKCKFDQAGVQCVTGPTWRFDWVNIGPTVQSYRFLSKFKMAAAAILDFVMESQEVITVILFYKVFFFFKFDENRLIGSKVTAVFQIIDFGWNFSI